MNKHYKNCIVCNKELINGGLEYRFCNQKCKFEYYAVTRQCKFCHQDFKTLYPGTKFCSAKCKKDHKRKIAKNHYNKTHPQSENITLINSNNVLPKFSRGEMKLQDIVTYIFYDCDIFYRKRYDWLCNIDTNFPLELDIYIPNINLAFEYDGAQHDKFNKSIHKTKDNFIKQQERDKLKDKICKDKGITLIRFKNNKDYVTEFTLKRKIKEADRLDLIDKYFIGVPKEGTTI